MLESPDLEKYYDALPSELTGYEINCAKEFLEGLSLSGIHEWTKRNTVNLSYEDQNYRTIINHPKNNNSDKAVVVLSEFATGAIPRLMAKSMVIRDMVDPGATLIVQPSSILGDPNMNFSHSERSKLYKGDFEPVIGRIALALNKAGNPTETTIFAPSQGATVGLAYASNESSAPVSIAIVEAPNIVDRTVMEIGKAFINSGSDLENVIKANFYGNSQSELAEYVLRGSKFAEISKFMIQAAHPDNFALAKAMTTDTAAASIDTILKKGGSVAQIWGDQDEVSPFISNELMARKFEKYPNYTSRVLRGLGHAATDFYALDGAIARIAANLL